MRANFEVLPLGTGNFFPTKRFNTSLLLCAGKETIVVDCPEPFRRMCALAAKKSGRKIDLEKLNNIVLTHLHGDHCNGLEAFGFWRKFHNDAAPHPVIHTSAHAAQLLWRKLSPSMGHAFSPPLGLDNRYDISDYYEVHGHEIGDKFDVCGVEFETRATIHMIPCFGFRAVFKGRKFGYSCDTAYDPGMIDFLADCDLIFHECDHGLHTHLEPLEALPKSIRKKMHLIHLPDDFKGSRLIPTAKEGKIYKV